MMITWYNDLLQWLELSCHNFMDGLPFSNLIMEAFCKWFDKPGLVTFSSHSIFSDLSKAFLAGFIILIFGLIMKGLAYFIPKDFRELTENGELRFVDPFMNFFFRLEETDSIWSIILNPVIDFIILIVVSLFSDPIVEMLVKDCGDYFGVQSGTGQDLIIFLLLFLALGLSYCGYYFAYYTLVPSGYKQLSLGNVSLGYPFLRSFALNMIPELLDVLIKNHALLLLYFLIAARCNAFGLLLMLIMVIALAVFSDFLQECLSNLLKAFFVIHHPLKTISNIFVVLDEACMMMCMMVLIGTNGYASTGSKFVDALADLPFCYSFCKQIPIGEYLMNHSDLFQLELYRSFYILLFIYLLNLLYYKIPMPAPLTGILWWVKSSVVVTLGALCYMLVKMMLTPLSAYWQMYIFIVVFLVVFILCPPAIQHVLLIDLCLMAFSGMLTWAGFTPQDAATDSFFAVILLFFLVFLLGSICSAAKRFFSPIG